ncbi:MAG: cupin domain-containing protein [Rhodothalassiaceae bacterium]
MAGPGAARLARVTAAVLMLMLAGGSTQPEPARYDIATSGSRAIIGRDGTSAIRTLIEAANLGGREFEMAEVTFRPRTSIGDHLHDSLEVLSGLEGESRHVVGGRAATLGPGMLGIVRPGDAVQHIVDGPEAARALVIWVPAGEVARQFGKAPWRPIPRPPLRP